MQLLDCALQVVLQVLVLLDSLLVHFPQLVVLHRQLNQLFLVGLSLVVFHLRLQQDVLFVLTD